MVEGTASGLLRCCCAWRCKHTHDEPACERPWPASQYSCRTRSSWTRLAGRLADCCSLIRRLHGLNSLVLITRHQHAYGTTPDQAIACPHYPWFPAIYHSLAVCYTTTCSVTHRSCNSIYLFIIVTRVDLMGATVYVALVLVRLFSTSYFCLSHSCRTCTYVARNQL
jgi:hypothetical protein